MTEHNLLFLFCRQYDIPLDGDCKFVNCSPNNIVVFNKNDMCLLKNNVMAANKPMDSGDINGINCSSLEMEDCNQTNDMVNDISTSSEQDCSVIVVDD